MANTKSAKKAAIKNEKRRIKNLARKTALKTAIRKTVLASEAGTQDVDILLADVAARLSRAKSKGLLHANTASRKLSRLTKRINARKVA